MPRGKFRRIARRAVRIITEAVRPTEVAARQGVQKEEPEYQVDRRVAAASVVLAEVAREDEQSV